MGQQLNSELNSVMMTKNIRKAVVGTCVSSVSNEVLVSINDILHDEMIIGH